MFLGKYISVLAFQYLASTLIKGLQMYLTKQYESYSNSSYTGSSVKWKFVNSFS